MPLPFEITIPGHPISQQARRRYKVRQWIDYVRSEARQVWREPEGAANDSVMVIIKKNALEGCHERRNEQSGIARMLQEIGVVHPEETALGTVVRDGKRAEVALIHQTGHLYARDGEGGITLLARLKVEEKGLEACLETARGWLTPSKPCDTPGCSNPAERATSIAPGTFVAVCRLCAGALAPPAA